MGSSLSKKKEQQLLQEVQEWMTVLDQTITSLANDIDVLHASARVVVCQLDVMLKDIKGDITDSNKVKCIINSYDAANHLLSEVSGTVANQKLYTLTSVRNCLNRICPLLKQYKATSSNLVCSPLSIDMYLKNKETATVNISPEDAEHTLHFDHDHYHDADNKENSTETKNQKCSIDNTEYKDVTTTKRKQEAKGQRKDKQIQTSIDFKNTEEEELQHLKDEILTLNEDKIKTNTLNENISKLKTECTALQIKLDKLKTEEHSLQEELSLRKRSVEERDGQIKSLEHKVKDLEENNSALDHQLQTLKKKTVLQVQLFCQPRGGLVSTVEEDLMIQLKKNFEDDDNKLKFTQCVKTTDVKPDIPLLVVCISASRIGTDVANILQGLDLTSKVSILVFHHKDVHALPNQASDRVLSGPQFENIGGIFDMAFLSNKGIYPCGMNDNSFISILNFLDREGTLTRKC